MKKEAWKSTGTAVYNINYHFVWSTKYRRQVLFPPIDETLKRAITALCMEHGYELLALEVMPDHIHVFLSAPPKIAPAVIAKVLKGSTARTFFEKHRTEAQASPARIRLRMPPNSFGGGRHSWVKERSFTAWFW